MPLVGATEVTVNEGFEDSTYEAGLTITTANNWSISDYSPNYGTTGNSFYMSVGTYTFEFSSDINVYELGFNVGAVDNSYSVKYYYSDGTDETLSMSAQNPSNAGTMYDNFYKSFTDYNNNEANTDKYITKFDVVVSDASLFDTLYWQYDDADATGSFGTTTTTTIPLTIGDPTNLTVSANLHNGSITVDWDAPTDGGYSPERYAIAFDKADPPMYAVATGNVGDENALNTEYTFTKSYLQAALDAQVGDTLYFKIRSDNDTNSLYSSWTTIASYTIQNAPSGVTDVLITNNEYQGLKIGWVQPNTGWGTVDYYTISYKLSSEETYTDIENIDVNATSYLIEDIEGGTYDFVVYACSSTGWCHGGQAGPITNYEVLSTTATTTTTTTTTTLPPPPPPAPEPEPEPEKIVVVMDDGTEAEYTEAQIADGTSDRDKERNANEDKWGCYVTNAALERGDCEAYNEALKTEEEIVDDIIIVEEKNEEIIDTKPNIVDEEIVEDGLEQIETDPFPSEEGDTEIQPEELVDEKDKVEITTTTTVPKNTTTTTLPIKEDFVDEITDEEEIKIDEDIISEEFAEEFTEEEIELLVEETETLVKSIIIIEDEVITEDMTEEEVAQADKEFEEKVEAAVKELPKEKKVEIVKEVAKVKVQNLQGADNITKAVVKAVVKEVTKTETVAQLSEEEKKDVGKVLGFQDENAADDVEIIAVQAEKEPAIAEAVEEYVDRAIENKDVENYTLADVVTEIQVEAFLDNPIGSLFDVRIDELDISSLGDDMTSDQKEKAQEVVVPVILASQIISSAGALMRRF